MKYIKKVDVTQLVTNTGTIIDSMSSGDDQHTNAPSIDAVKEYVKNTINKKTKTGTLEAGNTVYSDYINGFVGLVAIRVYTDNYEFYRIMTLGGVNKYFYSSQNILDAHSTDNPNAGCLVGLYQSPDTINYHVYIQNTGNVSLSYDMSLINLIY